MATYEKNILKNKRVFVSGGAGVIGSALVKMLSGFGCKIFVGDLKPKPKDFPKNVIYRQGDLNNISKEELKKFKPEYFFHLAATFERTEESFEFWNENFTHNIQLSHHLMNILKEFSFLKKIIFASSYLIYDPNLYISSIKPKKPRLLTENEPLYPRNTCGASKLLHEIELRFLENFKEIKFNTVSARIFRVYGRNSNDIISRWVRSLLKNEDILVYNKENSFDYIFADDVAEGLIRLAQAPITGIVNLGNGKSRTIKELIEILRKYFPEMKTKYVDYSYPYEASQADMRKFQKTTSFKFVKQLEEHIPKIIEFEKNRLDENFNNSYNFNILVTSISKKISMLKSIKKANEKLGNLGKIFGADSNNQCIGKYFVDDFWNIPKYDKLSTNQIISYCKKNNISCIIPSSDGELLFFAKRKNKLLKNGIHIMLSNNENVLFCLDKLEFFNKLKNLKFQGIKTSENIKDIKAKSYVIKERHSDFGTQPNKINLTKEESRKYVKNFKNPVFQPFIEGKEFSIDLYADKKSKVKGCIIRTRELIENGESQITQSIEDKALEKICKDLVEKLNLYGHMVVQVIKDSTNRFHILECNNRFGGASSLSLEVGLDTFYWFLLESMGEDLNSYGFVRSKIQKKQIRFPENMIVF